MIKVSYREGTEIVISYCRLFHAVVKTGDAEKALNRPTRFIAINYFRTIHLEWSEQSKHSGAKGIIKGIKNHPSVYGWKGMCLSAFKKKLNHF